MGMTERTIEILDALMGGTSYRLLQSRIEQLSKPEQKELLCLICCLRDEIANNCVDRAAHCDRLLLHNGHSLRPSLCGIRDLSGNERPRIGIAPGTLCHEASFQQSEIASGNAQLSSVWLSSK